ncbi:DUF4238 domain-containing protein [Pseudomonas antarctica]|uniref:DUF4238 domain-containing protein n=1 Tax=Pseudomonas antarctica TaxID=219572 RepID=UPI003F7543D0
MKNNLTKNQHYVPRVYLRGWTATGWAHDVEAGRQVMAHFLQQQSSEPRNSKSILHGKWFYEEDTSEPDNRIEKMFGEHEESWRGVMRFITFSAENARTIHREETSPQISEEQYVCRTLASLFCAMPEYVDSIKNFACISYFRTPAALKRKRAELDHPQVPGGATMAVDLSAFDLASQAMSSSLRDRFNSLNIVLLVAPQSSFVTSDRPCFDLDLAQNKYAPLLGYDIGRLETVVGYFPLSAKLAVLFVPSVLKTNTQTLKTPKVNVVTLPAHAVREFNLLTVKMADEIVVSTHDFASIEQVVA